MDPSQLIVDRIRWHIAPAAMGVLQPGMLDLAAHRASGRREIVKQGPHRIVYRIVLSDLTIYWKHCRLTGIRGYLRQCLRPPKAKMEYDRLVMLANRGVSTIEPLAWGQAAGRMIGETFLITRELPRARPLSIVLEKYANASPVQRNQIASQLGAFIAHLHDSGVYHPDLHPGNILTQMSESACRFALIDLHNIHLGKPIQWRASLANLAVFNRWFALRTSRTDRARFMRSYRLARREITLPKKAANQIEAATLASNHDFWRDRDRHAWGTIDISTRFAPKKHGAMRIATSMLS